MICQGLKHRSIASFNYFELYLNCASHCLHFPATKSYDDAKHNPLIKIAFSDNGTYFWDRPSKVGAQVIFPNGTQFQRGRGRGFPNFMTQEMLKSRDFIKGDDVYILLTVEGMSEIVFSKLFFFFFLVVTDYLLCSSGFYFQIY